MSGPRHEDEALFLRAIWRDSVDACPILADYLEEHGDRRGTRLRRRYRRYEIARNRLEEMLAPPTTAAIRKYVAHQIAYLQDVLRLYARQLVYQPWTIR